MVKVRTFCNRRNPLVRALAWVLTGLSASQLQSDITIVEHKVRLHKPMIQPFDGPFMRTNAWLKQFYSKSSHAVLDKYNLEW